MGQISLFSNSVFKKISDIVLIPIQEKQGLHIDPEDYPAPNPTDWPQHQRDAWNSAAMELFRNSIQIGNLNMRNSVIDDLAQFYGFSEEECIQKCLHWEEWSIQEWKAADRQNEEGLRDFYNSVQSWSFDLMWYAYLQTTGHCFPATVLASRFAVAHCSGRDHLDFGSGVGLTSQLFRRLGFKTTLADVSKPLLDFARWRLERRNEVADYLDLNAKSLPSSAFDCITALDTLVHVPDFERSIRDLHRALRPGGWLFANFDVRAKGSDASAWHLYDNAIDLDCRLQSCGFEKADTLGSVTHCYHRVEPRSTMHGFRRMRNSVTAPGRVVARNLQRVRLPTPTRVIKLFYRLATGRKVVTNTAYFR